MNLPSATRTAARPRVIAALTATAAMAITAGLAAAPASHAAPAARADNPTPLPATINEAIASGGLPVQVSNGFEAVTGPAGKVNGVRDLATDYGIGTVAMYTGDDESGRAILIFTGNNDQKPVKFGVQGVTISSVDDDTDQPWYVYDDNGTLDATISPGTAENIPPADAALFNINFNFSLFPITLFSF